ncbi:ATP-binding protein [Pseudoalteromonas sp. NEC-BIFX-2020_015]|uniref:AAA family ATPase n=1 Tax=Pseudoalteromonas sp. NEC-BIFX-2020_015 TaxID=2729544 RepID=UPI0014614682|nr:ATP-binding protein [Pseudoalteromonas sp. NEC-BIFX-2020_015]NMR27509.1 ATP-binding protein [Pseudoalteromonas sp. NEC-BIFX-2020_015]
MTTIGSLLLFCGKMGAGKSTVAKRVADARNAVLLSEDEWLNALYPEQIKVFADYIKLSGLLKPLLKAHVQNILQTGASVVMDFPANTKKQRAWLKSLAITTDAKIEFTYLKVSNELCLQQIAQRCIEQPNRAAFDTEAVFNHVTQYFEEPSPSEFSNYKEIIRSKT